MVLWKVILEGISILQKVLAEGFPEGFRKVLEGSRRFPAEGSKVIKIDKF